MQGDGRPAPGPSSASEIDLSVWQRLPDRAPDERLRAQGPRSTDEDPYSEPSSPFEPIVSSRRTMSITQFHPKEGEPNIPLTIRLDFVPPPHLQRQIHLAASRASEGKSTQSQIPFPFGFRICFGDYPLDTLVALQPLDLHQPSSQMKFMLQSVIPKRQSTLPHVPVSVQLTANHAVLDTAQIGVFMYWDTEAAPRNTTAPLPISEDRAVRSPSGPYSQLVPKGRRGDKVQNSRFVDRGLTQHVQQPNPDRQFTSPQYTHHDSSIRPQPPSLDTRSTSLPGMPHALAPSMFRNIPTPSPAPPSTPSSGHDSSAMQNSPIEERMRLPLHQETDTTPPVAQAPHSTQAPYRERSPLPRKPTPLAQRRSRRASAVQTQDSADTSTPDLGMEGEQEASSSTASTHRPRGFGARTSISGKPLIPSTLIRTSQLSSRRTTRNPVRLLMKGDLNNMALGWSEKDFVSRRRLVQFWRRQDGADVHLAFKSIPPEEYQPTSIVVSCIYRDDADECFITSVDLIYLLEMIIDSPFSIEEKNRIRRNLEGFKPQTVVKSKPGKGIDSFFALIMGFGEPKPRNIEKDLKVFPWKIIPTALEKVIKKYSYAPTTGALLDPIVCQDGVKLEEDSPAGHPSTVDPPCSPQVKLEDFSTAPFETSPEHQSFHYHIASSGSATSNSEGRSFTTQNLLSRSPSSQQSHQPAPAGPSTAGLPIGLHHPYRSLSAGRQSTEFPRTSFSSQSPAGSNSASRQTSVSGPSGVVSLSPGMEDVNEYLRSTATYMRNAPEHPTVRGSSSSPDSFTAEMEQYLQRAYPTQSSAGEASSTSSQYQSSVRPAATQTAFASGHQGQIGSSRQQFEHSAQTYPPPHAQHLYHPESFQQPSYPSLQYPAHESTQSPSVQYQSSYSEVSSYYRPGAQRSEDPSMSYGSASSPTAESAHRQHHYSPQADVIPTHAPFHSPLQPAGSPEHSYTPRSYEHAPQPYYVPSPEAVLPQQQQMISGIYKDPLLRQRSSGTTGESRSDNRAVGPYTWGSEYPAYGETSAESQQHPPSSSPTTNFHP